MRSKLIGSQIAITLVLLTVSGAAMRHFLEAYTAHLGFDPHHVLMIGLEIPNDGYPTYQAREQYFNALQDKIATTPGVESVSYAIETPSYRNWQQAIAVVGAPPTSRKTMVALVSASYFPTMRVPLWAVASIQKTRAAGQATSLL